MDAGGSNVTVSGHDRLLRVPVNADRMASALPDTEMNQPPCPNSADDVPSGLEEVAQPLKSTCHEREEALKGKEAKSKSL